jgi:hypothetical protein
MDGRDSKYTRTKERLALVRNTSGADKCAELVGWRQITRESDAGASGYVLKADVDKVFTMEDAGLAHKYMKANQAAGKVISVVD